MKYPLNNAGEVRKVNMSIRIPVEVVDYIKKRASEVGTSPSRLASDACVSWWKTEKRMEAQQGAADIPEAELTQKSPDQSVYLTDPYVHKPHIFIDQD